MVDIHGRTKSKNRVAPPVPPRRSSLSAASYSTVSLEDYANELGGNELRNKIEDSTDTPAADDKKKETSSKANDSPKSQVAGKGKGKYLQQRGAVIARSAKPHVLKKSAAYNPIPISQITLETMEKDDTAVVKSSSKDNELEEVYKKITKFNWNSNEFSEHLTASPPKK